MFKLFLLISVTFALDVDLMLPYGIVDYKGIIYDREQLKRDLKKIKEAGVHGVETEV